MQILATLPGPLRQEVLRHRPQTCPAPSNNQAGNQTLIELRHPRQLAGDVELTDLSSTVPCLSSEAGQLEATTVLDRHY
jgi:hypothetical protein